MSHSLILIVTAMILGFMRLGAGEPVFAQEASSRAGLDARVSGFLEGSRRSWRDLNVPYDDGQILYNLVIKGNFQNILEIGTSTGHSTIWLAWAASRTGGKVTTIEIDKGRHESALANFRKAGVESFIDARLADAHELVPTLKGPFDFVFCDADKEWYFQYFLDLAPRISANGCFTAHNVLWSGNPDIKRFLDQVRKDARFRTSIERGSGEGISVICRTGK
jgi:caffeoyl-CoA O-methyltransferase